MDKTKYYAGGFDSHKYIQCDKDAEDSLFGEIFQALSDISEWADSIDGTIETAEENLRQVGRIAKNLVDKIEEEIK
jgi:hypothetical protein